MADCAKILVVDDEEAILDSYKLALTSPLANHSHLVLKDLESELFDEPAQLVTVDFGTADFEVTPRQQGEEAVEAVRRISLAPKSERYAVAFIDVRMPPGINGVEAARQMHEIDPELMIVFVTGYSDLSVRDIEARFPSDAHLYYVRKPFDAQRVLKLASMLSRIRDGGEPLDPQESEMLRRHDIHQMIAA